MKVVIIEDEAPAFRRLQKILEEVDSSIEIIEVIDSVEEAVKWIQNHHEPDLFFMDIQLSDGISFDIFDQIKINKPIIFTTAFDEYMLKAFKVNSIDYLLKPIKKEDMAKSLRKFNELRNHYTGVDIGEIVRNIHLAGKDYKSRFLVKQGDKLISVKTEDIFLFQTRHGVVHITTIDNKRYLLDQPLDEIQENLDP
ncbi:MAG: response regulator, partial [Cyclobacteriaceae bacterium]